MKFCITTHMTYREYLVQPAAVMLKWRQMLAAESEGDEMRRRIEEVRAKARQH